MAAVVTVFREQGAARKTVTPPMERGRDGLRRDDSALLNIVTIVTPVTSNAPESSFGANRCQATAQ